ncbi:MAG: hypothetical protein NC548_58310 [Lachnospiraceae bacterium]|nr:hypothetical protein [Lachnospiraceae bacterium]
MILNILVLFIVFFLIACMLSKHTLLRNLFYTVMFIITLWINIPCFYSVSIVENTNDLIVFPFKFYNEWGIVFTICANILLAIILYLQDVFFNSATYSYKEIKKVYDSFGNDAAELYIIGKDLDFLFKKGFETQTKRIVHLGHKSKLLCEPTTDTDLLDLYKKVSAQGVEVRFYTQSDNITNLKGQIKLDQSGYKKAIFTSKKNNRYLLLSIENQFLVSTILDRCGTIYRKSTIPGKQ